MSHGFKHPHDYVPAEDRLPVSARVRRSTREKLEIIAGDVGLSVSQLVANILDDYIIWLESKHNNT